MSDYVSGLRQDLVEAAARQQAAGRGARVTRPLRPRAWSPVVVVGAVVALAALALLVLGLRAVNPPRPPEAPRRVGTLHVGGTPRDAAVVAGHVMVADFDGKLVRITPRGGKNAIAMVGATPVSIAADGQNAWIISLGPSQRRQYSDLLKVGGRTGRLLRTTPLDGESDLLALGSEGIWVRMTFSQRAGHRGSLERIDRRTGRRTGLVPADIDDLATSDRSLWTRKGETVTQRDDQGRVINQVRRISPVVGLEGQRTMVADADGAWVVGQSDGLLYRIESGRVVKRVQVGQLAGAIARTRAAVWVTAMVGADRYALVRVDPDDGTVTGRVTIGSDPPQTIVPVGKQVWVITGRGDVIRFSQG